MDKIHKKQKLRSFFNSFHIRYVMVFVLLVSALFLQANSQLFNLRFADEEDNIALGMYLNRGETLYQDLFSHHQPLGYVISAGVQKTLDPNSIYLLIKYHRLFVFAYASVWLAILIYRFHWKAVFFALLFEPTKYLLLGNLFLSESLSVYPLLYIIGSFFRLQNHENLSTTELLWIGFCFSLVGLLLAPLWPLLLILILLYFWKLASYYKSFTLILGGIPLVMFSLFFISIREYYELVFRINFEYYIPQETGGSGLIVGLLQGLLTPLQSVRYLFLQAHESLKVSALASLILLVFTGLSLKRVLKKSSKKNKLETEKIGLVLLILGLANIRYIDPGSQLYSGFHLLPWYAIICFSIFFLRIDNWKQKTFFRLTLVYSLVVSIMFWRTNLTPPSTPEDAVFIHYSESYSIGRAIEILSSGDTNEALFTAPDGWLLYWQSKVSHASRMLNYYEWMSHTPPIVTWVEEDLSQNPEYIYYQESQDELEIGHFITDEYTELIKENRRTYLYVLDSKIEELSPQQRQDLEFLGFIL